MHVDGSHWGGGDSGCMCVLRAREALHTPTAAHAHLVQEWTRDKDKI